MNSLYILYVQYTQKKLGNNKKATYKPVYM